MQIALNKVNPVYHSWSHFNQTKVAKPWLATAVNILDDNSKDFTLSDDMQIKIRELTMTAKWNIELLLIGDAGLAKADSCLDRMKELTLKAMDDILTDEDRLVIKNEINSIVKDMERNAYETENKVRGKLGLPLVKGYSTPFKRLDSDKDFTNYISKLYDQAKKSGKKLDSDRADTVNEVWDSLQLMRPDVLGVDDLDVTTVDRARISFEKVNRAKKMIAARRSRIERLIKSWVDQLDFACLSTFKKPTNKLQNNYSQLLFTLEFYI